MPTSAESALKDDLHRYLQQGREALVWKLEGASEHDVRRPLVPTGTNLLGLLKHSAGVEASYLGGIFGRPFPEPLPWAEDDAEDNADMWATPAESRADLVALYRRVWSHSDATVAALPLDAVGHVAWWDETPSPTLHRVLTHVVAEVQRHAGHADLVRELVDGSVGLRPAATNIPRGDDDAWWEEYRDRLEDASRQVG